jgi:hypothetical protein
MNRNECPFEWRTALVVRYTQHCWVVIARCARLLLHVEFPVVCPHCCLKMSIFVLTHDVHVKIIVTHCAQCMLWHCSNHDTAHTVVWLRQP